LRMPALSDVALEAGLRTGMKTVEETNHFLTLDGGLVDASQR